METLRVSFQEFADTASDRNGVAVEFLYEGP
jgi:hypothetical protein